MPAEWSLRYAEKTNAESGSARYVEVDGGTHFDVMSPAHPIWQTVTEWIREKLEHHG